MTPSRKATFACLARTSSPPCAWPPAPGSSTSSLARTRDQRRRRTRPHTEPLPSCRTLTTQTARSADQPAGRESSADPPKHDWPQPAKGLAVPTPYQIFALNHHAPYDKSRYYELVKIYHPDLSAGTCHPALSRATRIERYRLIVAAHAILSDPARRRAYDRFGAGWNGRDDPSLASGSHWSAPRHAPPSAGASGPFSQNWSDPGDPIWRNATWEDWERYHEQQAHGAAPRSPVYMANSYFLAVVMALAAVGASMNYGRAQDAGSSFVEQRDLVHDRAAKDLRRVRQEMAAMASREARIDLFVRQREATLGLATAADLDDLRDERARRVLPEQEICHSAHDEES